MPEQAQRHSMWINFWQAGIGLFVGIVVSSFIFGRSAGDLRQKVNDVVLWKAEAMPRIEKMDRGGSISFENFKINYDQEQAKQYKRLEKLEEAVQHIQTIELRLNNLERQVNDGKPRQE
jgi:hypothetical protein